MIVERLNLFVGFDSEQPLASAVFAFSAQRRCSLPLSITFLNLAQLRAVHKRPRDPKQTTEFAFTRFLVPALSRYEGWSIFADGDMLCRVDLAELVALRDPMATVMVRKHDQRGMEEFSTKFLGRPQTPYARKNWSSFMLMNNGYCRKLSLGYVERAPGLELHQFAWTRSIGELPAAWNHLVGVDAPNPGAKIVHFTLGMPTLGNPNACEYAEEWIAELRDMQRHVGLDLDTLYAMRAADKARKAAA